MIIKKSETDRFKTIEDFANKKSVYKTNTARKIAQTEIDNAQIQSLTRVPEVIMSLKAEKLMEW